MFYVPIRNLICDVGRKHQTKRQNMRNMKKKTFARLRFLQKNCTPKSFASILMASRHCHSSSVGVHCPSLHAPKRRGHGAGITCTNETPVIRPRSCTSDATRHSIHRHRYEWGTRCVCTRLAGVGAHTGGSACGRSALPEHCPVPPNIICVPKRPMSFIWNSGRISSKRASGIKLLFYDLNADGMKVQVMADAR